jgi:hypothetical protein
MLRPMATVVYSAGLYDDYHENGTTRSNLEIDDLTLQALNSTLQLSAIYMITDTCEFELNVPFFFKQWGGVQKKKNGRILYGVTWDEMPVKERVARSGLQVTS